MELTALSVVCTDQLDELLAANEAFVAAEKRHKAYRTEVEAMLSITKRDLDTVTGHRDRLIETIRAVRGERDDACEKLLAYKLLLKFPTEPHA